MKPRAAHTYQAPAEDDLQVDSEPYVEPKRKTAPQHAKNRAPWGTSAWLATGLGGACMLAGAAFAFGTTLGIGEIAASASELGLRAGTLVLGGATLAMFGILRRGQLGLAQPSSEELEDRLLLEQLTKDSLNQGETLERLENLVANLSGELRSTRAELEACVERGARAVIGAIPPPAPPQSPDEAIFRMAASLDQVGMRIEQRLKTQYTALQDHIEDVGAAILSARNQMQGLTRHGAEHAQELRREVQSQVEKALEETGFWSGAAQANGDTPLGVLDTIEDPVPEEHLPGEPRAENYDLGAVGSALPGTNEEPENVEVAALPLQLDLDTKTRLVELKSLLADPKLRRALGGLGAIGDDV